jgi:hypothetical protein
MATPKTKKSEEIVSGKGSYRGAKKAYKSKVKANKDIVKSNKKIDRINKTNSKHHSKLVKKSDKKYEKSEKVANKKDYQERASLAPGHIGGQPPRRPGPKPMFGEPGKMMKSIQSPTGPKPKRSDYKMSSGVDEEKGRLPQRATGSSASKKRNAAMITKMNKLHRGR